MGIGKESGVGSLLQSAVEERREAIAAGVVVNREASRDLEH